VDDTNEIQNKIKKGINYTAGKIIGKEEDYKETVSFRKNFNNII
jgi:hypothetical protein